MRKSIKTYQKLAKGGGAEANAALSHAYQTLDKMAKTGFIKKGKARRLKSRLAKRIPRG